MTVRPPLLQAIVPPFEQFSASTFSYPQLKKIVDTHYKDTYREISTKREVLSIESLDNPPMDYLPAISLKIQEATTRGEQEFWSQRFTEVSVEIFGKPELREAVRIAKKDLSLFKRQMASHPDLPARTVRPLFDAYEEFIKKNDTKSDDTRVDEAGDKSLLVELKAYLYKKYGQIYKEIDSAYDDEETLVIEEVVRINERMLHAMKVFSSQWQDWKVVTPESAQMAVSPGVKQIKVGSKMPPLPVRRVKSLFTHEVLVHAQRSVRGLAYSKRLAYGLPGYVTAEEGLGVLMEAAIEGRMPHRAGDRYVDIALALGSPAMKPMNRHQLFPVAYARTLLRNAGEATSITETQLQDMVSQHVARIYRGTLGNEVVGVFTKDVVYYRGYRLMADYLSRYKGKDLQRAIDFVLSSKINPDDPLHRQYVHDRKFNIIRDDE